MPTVIATIGQPGCGKTTAVNAWLAADPTHRARLARDGLRAAIGYGGDHDSNSQEMEDNVTIGQWAAVAAWLRAGLDVAVDDTCQLSHTLGDWLRIAQDAGAQLVVWDFRGVPPEVCIARDRARGAAGGRLVGEPAIMAVAARCAEVVIPAGVTVVDRAG
jgi:hypothetical protein